MITIKTKLPITVLNWTTIKIQTKDIKYTPTNGKVQVRILEELSNIENI